MYQNRGTGQTESTVVDTNPATHTAAQQEAQRPRQTTLDIYQNRATRQQNIDNAGQSAYTDISDNTVSGGAEGDTGAGAGGGLAENRDGVSDVYDKRDSNYQGQGRLGGLSVDSGFVLSEQAKSTIQSRGVEFVETRDVSADSAAFSSALDEARAANAKNGWAVSPKSAQDISETGVRVYMDENGSAGFGVAPDGDIEAVFANKSKGAPPHAAESLIPQAIAAGGSKLDCYGSGLVTLYSQYGFVPVARVVFDPEYANEGWDAGKGTPDIYFMMATDTDADSVVANGGSYPVPTQAELDALPLMDYESAYAYRDSLLAQQEAAQAPAVNSESQGDDGLGAANAGFDPVSRWQESTDRYHPVNEAAAQTTLEERGRVPTDVPVTDVVGGQVSKHVSTLVNANITTNEMAAALMEDARKGAFSAQPYTDAEAAAKVREHIPRTPQGVRRLCAACFRHRFRISIHAPRKGCDLLDVLLGILLHTAFQSTHPARGATPQHDRPQGRGGISIHAPRKGCDHQPDADIHRA